MSLPRRSVRSAYEAHLASGTLDPDPAQGRLVDRLDVLAREIERRQRGPRLSRLSRLFGSAREEPPPRGLYIWGGVGRGKTMLMDLFADTLEVEGTRRAHFHVYMAEVHARIHEWRQQLKRGEVAGDDPIRPVASALAAEAQVLCFDEFAVTDIADAMILGRLFTALFAEGVVLVATSNVAPDDLYRDGLNRALFLPFIRLLKERTEVVRLEARTDFRMEKLGDGRVYFTPLGPEAQREMDRLFARMTGGAKPRMATLRVLGRDLEVPAQAMGVARFSFDELCGRPLGASDYLAIARNFRTVFLDGIPRLAAAQRNEARRFITLIDVLYERQVRLVASAEAPPAALYDGGTGAEAFEFSRTVSRLHEMGSREYLAAARPDVVSGNATGLVET